MPLLDAPERLAALRATGLLDSPPEQVFDDVTTLVSRVLRVPVALLSLVDERRQFFKSALGLAEPWASMRETPLTHSFCQHAVARGGALIVTNAPADPRVRDSLAIPDLGVIAYAGVPVKAGDQPIGVLCAIDSQPRVWTDDDLELLRLMATVTEAEVSRRAVMGQLVAVSEDLQRQHAMMRAVFDAMEESVIVSDDTGKPVLANHAAERLLGAALATTSFTPDRAPVPWELYAADGETLIPVADRPILRALRGETVRGREVLIRAPAAPEGRWHLVNAAPVRDASGAVQGAVSVGRDITELRDARTRLEQAAVRDELTGLYNRRGLLDLAGRAVRQADRTRRKLALFYIDLNGMKAINDTHGHSAGDAALVETAEILRATFRASDVVARLGGDEFVALAVDFDDGLGEVVRDRVRRTMHDRNDDPRHAYRLSASIGVTVYDPAQRRRSLDELLAEADTRMYEAKVERGRRSGVVP